MLHVALCVLVVVNDSNFGFYLVILLFYLFNCYYRFHSCEIYIKSFGNCLVFGGVAHVNNCVPFFGEVQFD